MFHLKSWLALACFALLYGCAAQKPIIPSASTSKFDEKLYSSLKWRELGPYRGGRSAAVTGVSGKPNLFYFGSVGGGVWRTTDAGQTYQNISDGFFGGSVGAVSVSEWDNNVIYVGGGEQTVRGNVSYGYGLWKSTDAGKTWKQSGLTDSRHISRIRIHPKNSDLAYAAVMGDLYKTHAERGIFRTKDGGKTWDKILFVNGEVGAVDLCMDATNPRVLYASMWRVRRQPHNFSSGGDGSGLWKSTDGGDTWLELSKNDGFPKSPLGIIGVASSPVMPERVFAQVEAPEGGLFRSDDGGKTWKKMNEDRQLRQRAWYYTRIYADTKDADVLYSMNVSYGKSKDGGKTFKYSDAPHGDHHDLWIAPEDPQRMIIADDGGAQVSVDGGENWSTYQNQPTAQFYRVVTDNAFPYRIYAAQQDNSTIRIAHRSDGGALDMRSWEETAGGESAHIAPDPKNPEIVYGGSYHGYLTRLDHTTKQERNIEVYPNQTMGYGAEGAKNRFQWNYPVFFSPNDQKKLYVASNHLHVSTNEGQTWETISPDLTRNDTARLKASGGPITKDNTGVEYYCTIFAAAESTHEAGTIWTGSDDGLIQITRDGGKNWANVTPKVMPEWMQINSIEIDPFEKGGLYFAGTRYKSGDYQPYLYKTKDYGKTWVKITQGIDNQHFTRVVRADPKRKGLLYAGTETGMYISFDDGMMWQKFQGNLPIVPITDLTIKNDNLIAATQGRSIWMIDDLNPLHQINENLAKSDIILYKPIAAYRMGGGNYGRNAKTDGQNHAGGVTVHYFLKNKMTEKDTIKLAFLETDGTLIREFSTGAKEDKDKLKVAEGGNAFTWNTRYEGGKRFEGLVLWFAGLQGARAVPGKYKTRLSVNGKSQEQEFDIIKDPRVPATKEDFAAQHAFVKSINTKITETHDAIGKIREAREQMKTLKDRYKDNLNMKDVLKKATSIDSVMTKIEENLYQTKNRSGQDPLNFPVRLNNKLASLGTYADIGDFRPTDGMLQVRTEISALIDAELTKLKTIFEKDIPELNALIRGKQTDAIMFKK
jgi:photosystem II stability/assembly factor-like uncharacterized protein